MRLLLALFYEQRLRLIRRANARSGMRRLADLWYTSLRAGLSARNVARAFEPNGGPGRGLARPRPRQ
jgi:hypothetical protein